MNPLINNLYNPDIKPNYDVMKYKSSILDKSGE